jgi:hypothetical protein
LLGRSAVLLAAIAAGCSGSDEITGPPVTSFAGEYTYVVTGSGGTCVPLPRSSGGGVEIATQTEAWVTDCYTRDTCDGEACREGPVSGNVFTSDRVWTATDLTCEYRLSQHITMTRETSGALHRRTENHLEFVSGDCSAQVLPCDTWQTMEATPCDTACYAGYCPATLAPRPGAPSSRDESGM